MQLAKVDTVGNDKLLGLFPSELIAAEMTVARSVAVDGHSEAKILDDLAWSQVKVVLHDLQQLTGGVR